MCEGVKATQLIPAIMHIRTHKRQHSHSLSTRVYFMPLCWPISIAICISEINEVWFQCVIQGKQYIIRLHIPMDYALGMNSLQNFNLKKMLAWLWKNNSTHHCSTNFVDLFSWEDSTRGVKESLKAASETIQDDEAMVPMHISYVTSRNSLDEPKCSIDFVFSISMDDTALRFQCYNFICVHVFYEEYMTYRARWIDRPI